MKRIAKITGFTLGGIIAFLAVLFILIISGVINPWIIRTVSGNAANFIEGEISISKLSGNILSHFTLENVEIKQENKSLLLIEKLIKSKGEAKKDTLPSTFNWEIKMDHVQLKSIETHIKTREKTSIPEYSGLNAIFDFSMNPETTVVNLSEFDLQTRNPEFAVNNLAFNFQKSGQNMNWQNLLIKLPNSLLHSQGSIPLDSLIYSQISLTATPFNFEDFKAWLPGFYGTPEIKPTLQNDKEKNNIELQIGVPGQKLMVNGNISGTANLPEYLLEIKADSINGEYWVHNPELNSIISGELKLTGKGTDIRQNSLKALANFENIKYDVYEFSGILLDFNKEKGNISGNIKAGTFFWECNFPV